MTEQESIGQPVSKFLSLNHNVKNSWARMHFSLKICALKERLYFMNLYLTCIFPVPGLIGLEEKISGAIVLRV